MKIKFIKMVSKKINHFNLYILLVLAFSFSCGIKVRVYTKKSAIKYISEVSQGWKVDSIGTLGYRDKIYYYMEWTYDYKNADWNKVKDYFGEPNEKGRSYVKNGKASYLDIYEYYCKVRFDGYKYRKDYNVTIEVNPITNKIVRIKKSIYD